MNKKYKSSKTHGNELESTVKQWLIDSSIPFEHESTVTQNMRRTKGSVDFKLLDPVGFIECKRYTDRLSYSVNSEIHDISWSQISFLYRNKDCFISGFIVQESKSDDIYFIPIKSFVAYFVEMDAKSINQSNIIKIGTKITDMKWAMVEVRLIER